MSISTPSIPAQSIGVPGLGRAHGILKGLRSVSNLCHCRGRSRSASGAVLPVCRGRERTRSDADDDGQSNGSLGKHDRISCSDTAHPILACACIRKIGGWPDGPIKLQFRRLNSILCERRYVPSSGPSRWSRVPKPTTIKLDGLSAGTLKHQQA